ncbi:MAG: DUF4082 domain-containing protein [Myxococcaceae bacterium]|nr:DUF4082 domain-containing protein [Myxococcaceae bacterium]
MSHLRAFLVLVFTGCGGELTMAGAPQADPPSAPAMTVRVSSGELTLPVGETLKLTVTVTDPAGAPVAGVDTIEWSVEDPAIATVKDGMLTTLAAGITSVRATAYVTRMGVRAEGRAVVEVTGAAGSASRCGDGTCSFAEACQCLNDCGACSNGPTSLFASGPADTTAATGGRALVVGVKFKPARAGRVRALRFFKGLGATGTNRLALYSASGQQLAQATSRNETMSGWQQVPLSAPVALTAGTTYVVALHTSTGYVVSAGGFFAQARTNGPLRALADGEDGPNGLRSISTTMKLPTEATGGANHFVDVVFEATP